MTDRPLHAAARVELVHLVARMRRPHRFFLEPDHAAWMWQRLVVGFPLTVARNLMPNHLHDLALVDNPLRARNYLARVCGHFARRVGVPDLFEPLPPPEIVPIGRAPRVARYIDLNAVRSDLVDHPLGWPWTTLRDMVGAIALPAVELAVHGRALGRNRPTRPDAWLSFVTTDDRVRDRRPLAPAVAASAMQPASGVDDLLRATSAALRVPLQAIRGRGKARDLFAALAADQGLGDATLLARVCATTRRAFESGSRHVPPQWLAAARRCLADDRLTKTLADARVDTSVFAPSWARAPSLHRATAPVPMNAR
jgi:hypothetical protein